MIRTVDVVYTRPGTGSTTYVEEVLIDRPDLKMLKLGSHTGPDMCVNGIPAQAAGMPVLWFLLPGRWFDIGRFHDNAGNPTGWYTNLCMPPTFHDDLIECTDLFLDLWQPDEGSPVWLDRDEFDNAVTDGVISQSLAQRTLEEHREITALVARERWPPAAVIDAYRLIRDGDAR